MAPPRRHFRLEVCPLEHALHAELERLCKTLPDKSVFTWRKNPLLHGGDVRLYECFPDGDRARMLIELKTPADLAASIGGRLRDQVPRMLQHAAACEDEDVEHRRVLCMLVVVGYVREISQKHRTIAEDTGDIEEFMPSGHHVFVGGKPFSTLQSTLWRLIIRDGFFSMTVPSYRVLAEDLYTLVTHNAELLDTPPRVSLEDYERTRRLKTDGRKRETAGLRDVGASSMMVAMLQQVKGVSPRIGQAIRDKIKTMAVLIDVCRVCQEDDDYDALSSISVGDKGRTVGDALARRIVSIMLDVEIEHHAKKKRRKT